MIQIFTFFKLKFFSFPFSFSQRLGMNIKCHNLGYIKSISSDQYVYVIFFPVWRGANPRYDPQEYQVLSVLSKIGKILPTQFKDAPFYQIGIIFISHFFFAKVRHEYQMSKCGLFKKHQFRSICIYFLCFFAV